MRRRSRQHVRAARLLAATFLLAGLLPVATAPATSGDRTISFYNMHTKETLTVTYMRNGRHVPEAMAKINHMLRDWRRNEATRMDPDLIDLVYDIHRDLGAKAPVHIVSGYRSPVTNASLRQRSNGVAQNSQHTLGKAIDLYFPDVPVNRIREVGLKHQAGGVGYYPTSGQPFVHVDTGRVRHWPRMSREQLARIFPDGNTLHVPADGRPLARRVPTQDVEVASLDPSGAARSAPPRRIVVAEAPSVPVISDPARDVIGVRGSAEIPLLGYGRADETVPEPTRRPAQTTVLAALPPSRPATGTAAVQAAFVPPVPTLRPALARDAGRAGAGDMTVTAALPAAPLPPRRPEHEAARFALAGAPAPVAAGESVSGGTTFSLAELEPYVARQTVGQERFAILVAPDQTALGALTQPPARSLAISFAARPADQPPAQAFTGPAVQPLRVAEFAAPYRTAAR